MLTLSQIKAAYQAAIAATTIGNTFAIRDYLLYRIYENTYNSGSVVGTSLSIQLVQGNTSALLQTNVNNVLSSMTSHVKDVKFTVDETGLPCAYIIYYV